MINSFAFNVKKYRLMKGLTQEELGEKLGYKTKASVNKVELGLADIPLQKVKDYASALGVTVMDLLTDTEETEKFYACYRYFPYLMNATPETLKKVRELLGMK